MRSLGSSVLRPITLAVVLAALAVPFASAPVVAGPSYPVYCRGLLAMGSLDNASFIWASKPAKEAAPLAGQCAWPDRLPRGNEIYVPPIPVPQEIGALCVVASPSATELTQFGADEYFSIQVEAESMTLGGKPCLTPVSAPVLVTPEDRPWPVIKDPNRPK